ncbi:MAG: hypothetical protein J1E03_06215 [Acetatifactor sp.]|nr:hypothetical protein [Acetatifactor sp.]
MRINYNVTAMLSNNSLSDNDNLLAQSLQRLSSGLKINSAKDNPAGLAMAKRMNAQIESLKKANQNASDGVSIVETADGAMNEISEMLQRMNELAIKSANGTMSENDRAIIQEEIDQLKEEVTRIAETTEFNGQKILNGEFSLKGYTNNIDVKVNSYSDDVPTKEYTIKSLTVEYCEEEGIYRVDLDSFEAGEDFPEGVKVSIKDDLVILQDDNGFEMQLDISGVDFLKGKTVSETVTEIDENGERTERERVWKSVSFPPTEVSALDVTNASDGNPGDYSIMSITVIQNEDGTYSVDPGSVKLEGNFPDEVTVTVDNNTGEVVISGDGGFEVRAAIDAGAFANGVEKVTFPTEAASLVIDATGIGAMRIQVGANEGQILAMDIPAITLKNLGIEEMDVLTQDNARDAIERLDGAVKYVSAVRGRMGAYQNRLESTINNLDVTTENMTAAYSRIMDVDMAEEMTQYTTYQVLTQAGTSMLAQANERPSQVLQLLQ